MMRVVLLTHVFPRAVDDPLGAFLLHLIRALDDRAAVFVVAPHAAGLATEETIGAVPVTRFRYAADNRETLAYTGVMHERVARGISGKFLFARFLFAYFRATLMSVRARKPQVIHAHWWLPGGLVGALVSLLTRTPLIITTHGTDVEQLRRTAYSKPLARFTFRRARVITCGSTYLRDELVQLDVADPVRIRVIPMPVSPVFAHPPSVPLNQNSLAANQETEIKNQKSRCTRDNHRISHPSPTFNLLTISRLTRQKNIDTLLDALALLRARGFDACLTIIGDGDQRADLEAKTRAAGLEPFVQFLGMRPQTDLPDYYAGCDCFVLPSVHEGMGLVLAEALFCGAPVVATASGGITDIVRDGETGLLFPAGDASALADALEKYARDPRLAARLAEQGCAWVSDRYTPERVAEQFFQAYESAAAH